MKRENFQKQLNAFRRFSLEFRANLQHFHSEIYSRRDLNEIFTDEHRSLIDSIDENFQFYEKSLCKQNERFIEIGKLLTEFYCEHARLIDLYGKFLRFDGSDVKIFLENQSINELDQTNYDEFTENLLQMTDVEDVDEINRSIEEMDDYRKNFQRFRNDLKSILECQEEIFNRYKSNKNRIENWLNIAEEILNRPLTLVQCEILLNEHENLPMEQFQILSQQCLKFDCSSNFVELHQNLKSTSNFDFQGETNRIIEFYNFIKEKLVQWVEYLKFHRTALETIETAKQITNFDEEIFLPIDLKQLEIAQENFQVNRLRIKRIFICRDSMRYCQVSVRVTEERDRDIDRMDMYQDQ